MAASAPASVSLTTPAKLPSRTIATRPGEFPSSVLVECDELRRRHFRPQHAAMQHPRQRGIMNEARMARKPCRVYPAAGRTFPPARGARTIWESARRRFAVQRNLFGELPVAGLHIAGTDDDAVVDVERFGPDAQTIRRCAEKYLPRFPRRPAGCARPDCCTERLPEVTPSLGLPAVEARIMRRGRYRHRVRRRRSAPVP